ncbi:MAG: PEP-CTERM sorting domain-containing protein [Bryobacteraceae bacterium]|jgi:hypothetical protein
MIRLIASVFFFCILASSAWAGGGIKHPSDYGSPPSPIDFTACGSQQEGPVIAQCFEGTGESPDDFLFTFSLQNPIASTMITSVKFSLADVPTDFGLLEGTPTDCAAMNIVCTPSQITISNNPPLASPITLDFSNFMGDLSATAYFAYSSTVPAPNFAGATTSSAVTTPEPSEIGLLIAALASLIVVRQKQQAKQNG